MTDQFEIGTQFIRIGGKRQDIETIVDIHTTKDSLNRTVKVRYVATHLFMGQLVYDKDVLHTTIARSLIGGDKQ